MKFDANYFKGEEREGFYIKPMIKRAWAAQLEVLEQIDEICQRNHIEYYASSGTLLGQYGTEDLFPGMMIWILK